VCRAIQCSQESLRALAKRYGINQKTVAKWKRRTSAADRPTGPKQAESTVLSVEDEAIVVAFRRHIAATLISAGFHRGNVGLSVESLRIEREPPSVARQPSEEVLGRSCGILTFVEKKRVLRLYYRSRWFSALILNEFLRNTFAPVVEPACS
jgi:transposase-like protein